MTHIMRTGTSYYAYRYQLPCTNLYRYIVLTTLYVYRYSCCELVVGWLFSDIPLNASSASTLRRAGRVGPLSRTLLASIEAIS